MSAVLLPALIAGPLTTKAADRSCAQLFTSKDSGFRLALFNLEKRKHLSLTGTPSLENLQTPESLLAFVEARSQALGLGLRFKPQRLKKHGRRWAKQVLKAPENSARVRAAVENLYRQTNRRGFLDLKGKYLLNVERAVRERVESEILGDEIVSAFDRLGLFVDLAHREKLSYRLREGGGFEWALSLSMSALSPVWTKALLPATGGVFVPLIPNARFEYGQKLPAELREKIRAEGFDSAKTEVMNHFRTATQASWAWNSSRKIFYTAILILFLIDAVDYLPWLESVVKSVLESEESFLLNREKLGAEVIREQLLSGWRNWFVTTYNREPEAHELSREGDRLRLINDDRLIGRSR